MIEVPIRTWTPLGGRRTVISVAGNVDHIGNYVAEGFLHPSMFWPELAKMEKRQGEHAKHKLRSLEDGIAQSAYASRWVERWLSERAVFSD